MSKLTSPTSPQRRSLSRSSVNQQDVKSPKLLSPIPSQPNFGSPSPFSPPEVSQSSSMFLPPNQMPMMPAPQQPPPEPEDNEEETEEEEEDEENESTVSPSSTARLSSKKPSRPPTPAASPMELSMHVYVWLRERIAFSAVNPVPLETAPSPKKLKPGSTVPKLKMMTTSEGTDQLCSGFGLQRLMEMVAPRNMASEVTTKYSEQLSRIETERRRLTSNAINTKTVTAYETFAKTGKRERGIFNKTGGVQSRVNQWSKIVQMLEEHSSKFGSGTFIPDEAVERSEEGEDFESLRSKILPLWAYEIAVKKNTVVLHLFLEKVHAASRHSDKSPMKNQRTAPPAHESTRIRSTGKVLDRLYQPPPPKKTVVQPKQLPALYRHSAWKTINREQPSDSTLFKTPPEVDSPPTFSARQSRDDLKAHKAEETSHKEETPRKRLKKKKSRPATYIDLLASVAREERAAATIQDAVRRRQSRVSVIEGAPPVASEAQLEEVTPTTAEDPPSSTGASQETADPVEAESSSKADSPPAQSPPEAEPPQPETAPDEVAPPRQEPAGDPESSSDPEATAQERGAAATKIQAQARGRIARKKAGGREKTQEPDDETSRAQEKDFAVSSIQMSWRSYGTRRAKAKASALSEQDSIDQEKSEASLVIQRSWRRSSAAQAKAPKKAAQQDEEQLGESVDQESTAAASIIQRSWRRRSTSGQTKGTSREGEASTDSETSKAEESSASDQQPEASTSQEESNEERQAQLDRIHENEKRIDEELVRQEERKSARSNGSEKAPASKTWAQDSDDSTDDEESDSGYRRDNKWKPSIE